MAELVKSKENTGPIKAPAWDDVIHIQPRPELTKEDRKAWTAWNAELRAQQRAPDYEAIRRDPQNAIAALPSDLPPEKLAEFARKYAIYEQFRASEIPQWRQKLVKILTQLDNIEDDVSTVLWLAKPVLKIIPGGRVIEAVGRGFTTALDRMERIIAGPSIAGRSAKHRAKRERKNNARTQTGKVSAIQKGAQWLGKNYGKLLEAGQSADTHTGVGLSLGAIFGAMEEAQDRAISSAWNGAKYIVARTAAAVPGLDPDIIASLDATADLAHGNVLRAGVPLQRQLSQLLETGAANLFPLPAAVGRSLTASSPAIAAGVDWFGRALGTARAAIGITQDNPHFTPGEHALALLAAPSALAAAGNAYTLAAQILDIEQLLELPSPRTIVRNPATRLILEDLGVRFNARGQPIGEWAEQEIPIRQEIESGIDAYLQNHDAWLPPADAGDDAGFLHALVEHNVPTAALMLTGSADGIRTTYEPDVRAEMLLYHTGEYPPQDLPPEKLRAWLADQLAAIEAAPDDYDERVWRAITRRHWPTSQ